MICGPGAHRFILASVRDSRWETKKIKKTRSMDMKFKEKTEVHKNKEERKAFSKKEDEKKELAISRGEVTPPSSPIKEIKVGSGRRSPGGTARKKARLLKFQQEFEQVRVLPTSRLQEKINKEEKTLSPASSPRLKPARVRGGEVVGKDLRKEIDRLGADEQHHPLATPLGGGILLTRPSMKTSSLFHTTLAIMINP